MRTFSEERRILKKAVSRTLLSPEHTLKSITLSLQSILSRTLVSPETALQSQLLSRALLSPEHTLQNLKKSRSRFLEAWGGLEYRG